jgi:hypothetical protein
MSNIRLRDHSRGLAVGRSISWRNLIWRGNDCFVVDWSLFWGIYFMGREHVQLLYQSTPYKWERDRTIGTMNFERFVNVFLIVCLNQVNLSMFSSLLIYMNGLCEYLFSSLLIWMESVNVFFIVCLYEWTLWMFS